MNLKHLLNSVSQVEPGDVVSSDANQANVATQELVLKVS